MGNSHDWIMFELIEPMKQAANMCNPNTHPNTTVSILVLPFRSKHISKHRTHPALCTKLPWAVFSA